MMHQGWGRIVNVTTSLGTMIRDGSPTYGPSKAALEAFFGDHGKGSRRTGVTVNVLVPGGSPIPAWCRSRGIRPGGNDPARGDGAAAVWLLSERLAGVSGRRFLAVHWIRRCRGSGGGKGRRADRLDQHRDDADRAGPAELVHGLRAPPRGIVGRRTVLTP